MGKNSILKKKQALDFLKHNGIVLGSNINYASRQDSRPEFWINPREEAVYKDWELVLNNQYSGELIYVFVPANTFIINKDGNNKGLFLRQDKPYIDLNIDENTFLDRRSKYDFSKYIVTAIKYK